MIKRSIYITTPHSLTLKDRQMVLTSKEDSEMVHTIPIEDLSFVVIEDQQTYISIPLMNALADNNVSVVICDARHMPNGMMMNLEANYTMGATYREQIEASEPLKKSLWKQIIISKITNQSLLLDKLDKDGTQVRAYASNVLSGDTDNREGVAAKLYWSKLMGEGFERDRYGDTPNNLLNYGYAILRAAVARALMGSGLFPAYGLFHHNQYNAFPLADDMMEPYRPYVDEVVFGLYANGVEELDKESKYAIMSVLYKDVLLEHDHRPLDIALRMTTSSLAKCFAGETKKLRLPKFM